MQNIPGVARNTTEAAASKHCSKDGFLATQETKTAKCETHSSNSTKHFDTKESQASGSIVVESEASIIAEDEVIVNEEPERKAPTDSDVEHIAKQLREFLHEKGPSQEDDLVEALRRSQAQLILATYATLTAFLDRRPRFHAVYEDLYSFFITRSPMTKQIASANPFPWTKLPCGLLVTTVDASCTWRLVTADLSARVSARLPAAVTSPPSVQSTTNKKIPE